MIEEITTACPCPVTDDARRCYELRYRLPIDENLDDEQCECSCHEEDEDGYPNR